MLQFLTAVITSYTSNEPRAPAGKTNFGKLKRVRVRARGNVT